MDHFLLPWSEGRTGQNYLAWGTLFLWPGSRHVWGITYPSLRQNRTGPVWGKAVLGPPSSMALRWFNTYTVSVPRVNSRLPLRRRRKMDGWICNLHPPVGLNAVLCSSVVSGNAVFTTLTSWGHINTYENLHAWMNEDTYGHSALRAFWGWRLFLFHICVLLSSNAWHRADD